MTRSVRDGTGDGGDRGRDHGGRGEGLSPRRPEGEPTRRVPQQGDGLPAERRRAPGRAPAQEGRGARWSSARRNAPTSASTGCGDRARELARHPARRGCLPADGAPEARRCVSKVVRCSSEAGTRSSKRGRRGEDRDVAFREGLGRRRRPRSSSTVLVNDEADEGIASSIRAGTRRPAGRRDDGRHRARRYALRPTSETIRALVAARERTGGAGRLSSVPRKARKPGGVGLRRWPGRCHGSRATAGPPSIVERLGDGAPWRCRSTTRACSRTWIPRTDYETRAFALRPDVRWGGRSPGGYDGVGLDDPDSGAGSDAGGAGVDHLSSGVSRSRTPPAALTPHGFADHGAQ